MTRPPDMLRFNGGAADEADADGVMVGWAGPWPPPSEMGVAVGKETGMVKVFEPATLALPLDELLAVAHVTIYERESASVLPDDFESETLFRGAQYRPKEDGDV